MPNKTKGKWSNHVPEPEEQARDINLSLRVLCWRSIRPLLCGWYDVVIRLSIPRRVQSSDQTPEVNWRPLSVTMDEGTPYRETQWKRSARAQSTAVMEESGIASSHREKRSMTVRR